MNNPVHILYLEDNPRDAELVRDKLQQASLVCDLRVASSRLEYEGALAETRFDLILSDYNLLDYDGMTALALAREKQPAVPFILISGTLGEEKAVDCMLRGATDYVHKQRLDRLVPAVLRALTEAEDRLQRKLAEVASLASSKRLDFALQASHIGAWEVDLLNHTTYHTLIHDQILGYATLRPSWTYETFLEHVLPEDRPMVDRRFCEAMGAQIPLHFECRIRRPDGEVRWIGVGGGSEQDSAGKVLRMSGIVQDISERKQGENRERLAREVMELLNHPINTRDTIHDILRLIKLSTGFEAVGLRLREGDDFPYYETDGFPEAFVRAENTLTARDPAGGLCQDKNGNLSLECTCGLVISGKTDPANPIFSPGGSFWTNDSFPLLDLPPTQETRLHPRNRCIHSGYHSVALIPLRSGGENIGLLQLNDHRPNQFTPEMIRFFEGLGASIGIALTRKQTDFKLQETLVEAQRFREALDHAPGYIYLKDIQSRYLYANQPTLALFGCSAAELIGCDDTRFFPSSTVKRLQEIDARVCLGEVTTEEIDVHDAKGGRRIYWEVKTPIYAEPGSKTIVGLMGISTDITERKQTEERLRKQAALLDMANDAIYVRGLDHTVRYWNQGAERLYGWTSAEALGRKITDLKIVDLAAFETAHAALLNAGTWTAELKQITKAGQPLTILYRWTLLRDAHGQPEEVLAINTDLTEHKKLELQFFHAQRIESIGSLAGGIAHDLNNILAPILMTAPHLRRTVSDPDSRMMIEAIETCAQRGVEIIKQLLTFARGTPGVHVSLPVRLLMRELRNIIRETFPRNIQPFVETPKNLWPVLGDATQFHQVLLNLCVNARDAMPDGGTLTLTVCNVTLDATSATMIPNAKPGPYVCVSVTDTGIGIPPEILDRIFDPFFTTKEIGKGTGLGLATTLGIVRGHSGFVRVDSQLGRGTTFQLYFPATPEARADAVLARKAPPDGAGELILVVDDEACLLDALRFTLEHHGYRALTAINGAEGLAAFSRQHAEVRAVLADIIMPVMDGPTMITALRAIEPDLPILGMTGLLDDLKRLKTIKLSAWLAKPFSEDALLSTLHNTFHPAKAPARKGAKQDD